MTITYTVDTWMAIDARDTAVRRAPSEGWANIQVLDVRAADQRRWNVDLLVSR